MGGHFKLCLPALIAVCAAAGVSGAADLRPHWQASVGHRVDHADWHIAADLEGGSPNVLSELSWDTLRIFQTRLGAGLDISNRFRLQGEGYYGWLMSGSGRDSDYLFDDRQGEFSRSAHTTEGDSVRGGSLAGGPILAVTKRFSFIPLAGYSWDDQFLRLTDGVQQLSQPPQFLPVGPFGGLNSTYEMHWQGPWLGFQLQLEASRSTRLLGSFAYHWTRFNSQADWNLRSDFQHPVSFVQHARGTGLGGRGEIRHLMQNGWWVGLRGQVEERTARDGTDTTFTTNPFEPVLVTRLNEVHWGSWSVMATLGWGWR